MIEMFLHLQHARKIDLVKVDPDKTVEDLTNQYGAKGAIAWLEDGKEPLKSELSLTEQGVTARCHIHISSCQIVELKVRYNGISIEGSVSPAVTGEAILRWASGDEGFKLTDGQIAKHELLTCDTKTELGQATHVGFLADGDCTVCLDLVPKERFQG